MDSTPAPAVGNTFVPRRAREQTEREEKLRAALGAMLEDATDRTEIVCSLVHIVVLIIALRAQDRRLLTETEQALDATMDELVAFDVRCAEGDVTGAVAALRGWLGRMGA
jgi:hypothetical protein